MNRCGDPAKPAHPQARLKLTMKAIVPILLLCLAGVTLAETELPWRSFKSSDGEQTFEGRLIGYQSSDQTVTVRMKSGQTVTFAMARLSAEDRDYVVTEAPEPPISARLDLRFTKIMDETGSERDKGARSKTYNGGYNIQILNYSPQALEDVEVEYLIIYRKDATDGLGERMAHKGSTTMSSLLPNLRDVVVADGIALESSYEPGTSSVSAASGCSSCGTGGSVSVTKSQRTRDVILGCVARVKSRGQIVHTAASSPDILRRYADAFDSDVAR
jgi:hypothetical protein